ncbi:MAG TPA: VWA domain-containing protein [Silvibacterium sp.]|nr:VWA domain-containing protein [Silvibacterium sp.]
MRSAALLVTFLLSLAAAAPAQSSQSPPPNQTNTPTLTVRSTLVEVPALVTTKDAHVVFTLTANDFLLTDDGVPQHLNLVDDTDSQPLALVIVVETGGAGARHLADYQNLDPILDGLIGNVEHRVALVAFDSTPRLLLPFIANTGDAASQLENLYPGDQGAAILDALAFAVGLLRDQPTRYRRAILLLSETIDQGSTTTLTDALRLISDTNTAMYSFGFSSTRSAVSHEASKFNGTTPGPAHGCFSREGADAEYKGHYSAQVLDCISQLAPPVRLATMAFLAARSSLRTNTAESIAQLTGGEFFHFRDARSLQRGLIAVSRDVPNAYVLSFHPTAPTPGMHALHLELKDRSDLRIKSRSEYWIDSDTATKQ